MKKYLFLYIALLGCAKDNTSAQYVTISNANPIQFWVNGVEETFNQKIADGSLGQGISSICFCQQFYPNDVIRVDIQDIGTNILIGIQEDNSIVDSWNFSSPHNGHEFTTIDLSLYPEIIDKSIFFRIVGSIALYDRLLPPNTPWSNVGGGYSNFTKTATQFTANATGGFQNFAAYMQFPHTIPKGITVKFKIVITTTGALNAGICFVTFQFYNDNPVGGVQPSQNAFSQSGIVAPHVYNDTVELTMTDFPGNYLIVTCGLQSTPSAGTIAIEVDASKAIYALEVDPNSKAESDCIDIVEDDCSQLITYTNSEDFAGLDYSDISPGASYNLRIPAVFFEEKFPDEFESLDLSNSEMVQLRSEVKHKIYLETGHMPFYMHEKMQLILAHDNIRIGDKSVLKLDAYEIMQARKNFPLRKATVWLTDKDYIQRNIL